MISKDAQSRTRTHNYRKALYRITQMRTTKNSNECSVRFTTTCTNAKATPINDNDYSRHITAVEVI